MSELGKSFPSSLWTNATRQVTANKMNGVCDFPQFFSPREDVWPKRFGMWVLEGKPVASEKARGVASETDLEWKL